MGYQKDMRLSAAQRCLNSALRSTGRLDLGKSTAMHSQVLLFVATDLSRDSFPNISAYETLRSVLS